MIGQVVQSQGMGLADQQPEHPVPPGKVTDRRPAGRGKALGHELDQVLPVRPHDSHRPVPGIDELTGRVHDPRQHLREIQAGGHRHHRVEKRPKTMVSPLVVQRPVGGHEPMLRRSAGRDRSRSGTRSTGEATIEGDVAAVVNDGVRRGLRRGRRAEWGPPHRRPPVRSPRQAIGLPGLRLTPFTLDWRCACGSRRWCRAWPRRRRR